MKTMKKMLIILMIITALTASIIPSYATPTQLIAQKISKAELAPAPTNTIREVKQAPASDLSDLDDSTVDEKIKEAVEAAPVEEPVGSTLWYLDSNGYTTPETPVTDAAQSRFRIRLQLIAEKIKMTKFGALYEIHWGRVTHNGAQYEVEGYALLDSDGVFYMKLDGDVTYNSIGRIQPVWFGVRVLMKGYLVDGDTTYSHYMRGWAIPLNFRIITR
jgi:competence protein ComGC